MTRDRDRRWSIVAFVLCMAVMVAWAPGSVAAGHGLVVVSENTTANQLGGASITNAVVERGGEPGFVGHDTYNTSATARWALDYGTGDTAYDHIGSTNIDLNGTTWTTGVSQSALNFDGSDYGTANQGYSDDFNNSQAFTISSWLNPDATGNQHIIDEAIEAGDRSYSYKTASGDFIFNAWDPDDNRAQVRTSISADVWTHIAVAWNGSSLILYKNGTQVDTAPLPNLQDSSAATNFGRLAAGGQNYDGQIDDIRFYTASLNDTQVGWLASYPNAKLSGDPTVSESSQYEHTHSVTDSEEAYIDLSLVNSTANVTVEGSSDGGSTWTTLNQTSFTTSGNKSLTWSPYSGDDIRVTVEFSTSDPDNLARLHGEGILFTPREPTGSNLKPPDGTKLSSSDVDFSVDVNDTDFSTAQGDSVDATLYIDGSQVGTKTVTSNQTVTITKPLSEGGDHTYYWELNDSYGESTTTSTNTITVPSNLTIYDVKNPSNVVNDANATVRFYSGDKVFERNASDGTVNLTGLPVDETFIVTIDSDGYYQRSTVIKSIYNQQEVYILPTNATKALTEFVINDPSNTFGEGTLITVQRAITKDFDGDGNKTTQYQAIAGDEIGVSGFTTQLEMDVRYRLILESPDGDTRVLGAYTPKIDNNQVTLEPQPLGVTLNENETYSWQAYIDEQSTEVRDLVVEFKDPQNKTTDLTFTFHEQGNKSNTLPNETVTGPVGEVKIVKVLNGSDANTTWVVGYTATRNDSEINGTQIVGVKTEEQIPGLPDWMQEAAAVLFIIMTAGLFSKVNASTGAVTTSMVAGGFWYAAWLPYEAGAAIMVALVAALGWKFYFTGGPG